MNVLTLVLLAVAVSVQSPTYRLRSQYARPLTFIANGNRSNWYDKVMYAMEVGHSSKFEKPLVAWLGDDFTGAAAVMEVLSFAGLHSILYVSEPDQKMSEDCKDYVGVGVATLARSHSPAWMSDHLPSVFEFLDRANAELVHHKICSTLDSSSSAGSIGREIEVGRDRFGISAVPVVAADPAMRRYQAFGSLVCAEATASTH